MQFMHFIISWSCSFQEQYKFLHHALVHTLTLSCDQIPADTFPQYVATTSAAEFAEQFKASLHYYKPNFYRYNIVCINFLFRFFNP